MQGVGTEFQDCLTKTIFFFKIKFIQIIQNTSSLHRYTIASVLLSPSSTVQSLLMESPLTLPLHSVELTQYPKISDLYSPISGMQNNREETNMAHTVGGEVW